MDIDGQRLEREIIYLRAVVEAARPLSGYTVPPGMAQLRQALAELDNFDNNTAHIERLRLDLLSAGSAAGDVGGEG